MSDSITTEKNSHIDGMDHQMNDGILLSQVGTKAIIYDSGLKKYLVLKSSKKKNPKQALELPGGRVDEGETDLRESLKRELREELGDDIQCSDEGVIHAEISKSFGGMSYTIIFSLFVYQSGEIRLSDEHDEYYWLTVDELIEKDAPSDRISRVIQEVDKKTNLTK